MIKKTTSFITEATKINVMEDIGLLIFFLLEEKSNVEHVFIKEFKNIIVAIIDIIYLTKI